MESHVVSTAKRIGGLVVDTSHGPGVVIERKADDIVLVDLFKERETKSTGNSTPGEDPYTTEIVVSLCAAQVETITAFFFLKLLPEPVRLRARRYLHKKIMKIFPGQGFFTGTVSKFLPPVSQMEDIAMSHMLDTFSQLAKHFLHCFSSVREIRRCGV